MRQRCSRRRSAAYFRARLPVHTCVSHFGCEQETKDGLLQLISEVTDEMPFQNSIYGPKKRAETYRMQAEVCVLGSDAHEPLFRTILRSCCLYCTFL